MTNIDQIIIETIDNDPAAIKDEYLKKITQIDQLEDLEKIRLDLFVQNGAITQLVKKIPTFPVEHRKQVGQRFNEIKDNLYKAYQDKKEILEKQALDAKLVADKKDLTLPVRPENDGRIHPITQTIEEIMTIFGGMGFDLAEGPDIEDDFHNFTALNFPAGHPARDMHDTFYFPEKAPGTKLLLRTHTSTVQIRSMKEKGAPIRIIAPGRTYRSDSDMTHTPMFHQVEGLYIDKDIHMGHLKNCLHQFCWKFFGIDDQAIRLRPSFFPFTEPSAEVDIKCTRHPDRIELGVGDSWLEILGCGMVHPNVLKNCGIDPEIYQGFAFGMGIERIAMLKYGIPDLRTFFEADWGWLQHYGFSPYQRSPI
ncbi:MAG: phenylalanine--tRNA ligase subunit alpha [Alphaproteobacteria bacterium]|nr:phenylalanine--tRNA ligase subunit alpha [Alphaproteobacteria bacterium]